MLFGFKKITSSLGLLLVAAVCCCLNEAAAQEAAPVHSPLVNETSSSLREDKTLSNDSKRIVTVTPEALEIHRQCIVIDGHNDLPWKMRKEGRSFDQWDIAQPRPEMHTDIPRLRKGGVGAQFWSVYVPVDEGYNGTALSATLEQIAMVREMLRRYSDVFEFASTADDIVRIQKQGKIASMIGVEGGYSIENSLANLGRLYKLGTRYMTLTHNDTLDWADSATDAPRHGGLNAFGEEVVREMNRLGMMVDLSHVSPDTMKHVLRVTKAPIIFSHSSARAVADHPRNVPDEVLMLIPANGGVVMVNFCGNFVSPEAARIRTEWLTESRRLQAEMKVQRGDPAGKEKVTQEMRRWSAKHPAPKATIHQLVDHIDHIVKVAGIDHVGIGSDFDGVTELPEQLEDVSTYPRITQELLNRGYTKEQIRKVMGENLLRVMRKVEDVAGATKAERR
jgi:membrane dipeptidase